MTRSLKLTSPKVSLLALAGLVLAVGAFPGGAVAAPILPNAFGFQPASVVASSNFGDPYFASRMIDQSGLSAGYVSGVTTAAVIDAITLVDNIPGWHGAEHDTTGNIVFDMGTSLTLDRAWIFWMNFGDANNLADFTIQVSADALFTSPTLVYTNVGAPTSAQELVEFTTLATGRFIRVNWTSLQGSYPGMNEFIAGGVSTAVPEPVTLALFGAGLGAIAWRRRLKTRS